MNTTAKNGRLKAMMIQMIEEELIVEWEDGGKLERRRGNDEDKDGNKLCKETKLGGSFFCCRNEQATVGVSDATAPVLIVLIHSLRLPLTSFL